MTSGQLDLVTGAFGNTGAAIAERLRQRGRQVRTLTNHPPGDPPEWIDVRPFADRADDLAPSFEGVSTFYNTFWMRTGDDRGAYDAAVARSLALIEAAERAGVQRIVHLSVIKPSLDSPFPYFRAKAQVEEALASSGVEASIVRPALIFGGRSPLLNNLAWILRRAPIFGIAGDGRYRVRPVHLDDVADLCVGAGERSDTTTIDAVGPERPTYEELVRLVRDAVGSRSRLVHLPANVVLGASKVLGTVVRDQLLTREELISTMQGIADSDEPASGRIGVSDWVREHAGQLGRRYQRAQ